MSIASMFYRSAFAAVGSALVIVPVTAMAVERHAARDDDSVQKFEVRKNRAGQTVYCARVAPATGSRIVTTQCQTAEEWKTDGVNLHIAPADA